jgi:hypothetical protein
MLGSIVVLGFYVGFRVPNGGLSFLPLNFYGVV